ncbi:hypothetical protein ABR36_11470 [Enterobacter ludwigii]|nr:hypothetical protein ABR36_11470 [Enterobacter ludwigii]
MGADSSGAGDVGEIYWPKGYWNNGVSCATCTAQPFVSNNPTPLGNNWTSGAGTDLSAGGVYQGGVEFNYMGETNRATYTITVFRAATHCDASANPPSIDFPDQTVGTGKRNTVISSRPLSITVTCNEPGPTEIGHTAALVWTPASGTAYTSIGFLPDDAHGSPVGSPRIRIVNPDGSLAAPGIPVEAITQLDPGKNTNTLNFTLNLYQADRGDTTPGTHTWHMAYEVYLN